ncbi:MAG: CpsD/CapB family tyrosine-protein kinase [Betaproteobacteria bacterium]|nr:CpsD/CapB family tyrosine-protein kinase [Betaproteobacteria bacterium]
MEHITEALRRVRSEPQAHPSALGAVPHLRAHRAEEVGSIVYTQTRNVVVPPAVLRERRVITGYGPGPYADAYKILRTQVLKRMRDLGANVLAVTSPSEGEGSTLVAINLAISLAMEVAHTVLLVDANLRTPRAHDYFGLRSAAGLSHYLTQDAALEDLLIHPGIDHFVWLPAGERLATSSEMLGSPRMAALVDELKHRYPSRIVIFDLPPVLSAADALAFAPLADCALLVVEEGKTPADKVAQAAHLLGSRLIGTVLNKSQESMREPAKTKRGLFSRLLQRG